MADLEQVTREVWNNYIDLNTTHRIAYALIGIAPYRPLRILAYGKQGSGKTTFMYYSLKTAYVYHLCHEKWVKKGECLEYAMKTYGLCLGRDCPKDPIDEELLPGFYVTVDDLLRRFIEDVRSGEIAERRAVFFDDAFTPKTWWLKGGEWRSLYYASRDFDQFYRDSVDVLIMTAPHITYFTKEYIANSLILQFNAVMIEGRPYTVAYHYVYPHYTRYEYGKPLLVRVKRLDYIDKVPIRSPYGLPRWLENAITERRQYVLRQSMERVLQSMKEGEGW